MKLEKKLKIALTENRLLILGSEVLFGFQFHAIFQERFADLPYLLRAMECSSLILIMLAIALLIGPWMGHRIVESGVDSPRTLALAASFAGWALLPLAAALALDMLVAIERAAGIEIGTVLAVGFFVLALAIWYGLGVLLKQKRKAMPHERAGKPPLDEQINQLLTEARVIIPGVQALLGFQLVVTLTQAFAQVSPGAKLVHVVALCCVGLAMILLMAPASLHRITFDGEDDPRFMPVGSGFVIAAPLPLAIGIALDTYVAVGRALQSATVASVLAAFAIVVLVGLWYAFPVWQRIVHGPNRP